MPTSTHDAKTSVQLHEMRKRSDDAIGSDDAKTNKSLTNLDKLVN